MTDKDRKEGKKFLGPWMKFGHACLCHIQCKKPSSQGMASGTGLLLVYRGGIAVIEVEQV